MICILNSDISAKCFGILYKKKGDLYMRIAICDDVQPMLDFLEREIKSKFAEKGLEAKIYSYTNGRDFLRDHQKNPFDVVFLDIVMPDMNGFDVAKQIRAINSKTYIIFITTEVGLVIDSLDFQPFHFIPKGSTSVIKDRLDHVIDKLVIHLSVSSKIELPLPYGKSKYVDPMNILYVMSSANYVEFILFNKETIRVRGKLPDMIGRLNPYIFCEIHNRFIVNMKHIKKVDFSDNFVTMYNGDILNISRSFKDNFEQSYNRYLRSFE